MALLHISSIRLLAVILVFSTADCRSKQFLQTLLRQTNNNVVLSNFEDNDTSKETRLSSTSGSIQVEDDISQPNSYKDFHKLFYGEQESNQHFNENSGPNDIRERAGDGKELNDVRQANEHFLKIRTSARCRTPRSKVIRVKDYYPDPSKEYIPRCTIIYRCGDDSGCCDNDAFECVPRYIQDVALPFYTLYIGKHGPKIGNTIEKLIFVNHTQCECQPINDQPRIEEQPTKIETPNKPNLPIKCRECPIPFYRREYPDGRCTCDCFDRQRPCLRIKRGRDSLSEVEKRCVESGYCHIPECEYGEYNSMSGLCPKRTDAEKKNIPKSHRWTFFERD